MHKFDTIDYLKSGNERQQQAYAVLSSGIIDQLKPYNPILAGTIPLGIDIESSDLDILCYWTSKADFTATLQLHYSHFKKFKLETKLINGEEAVIANFKAGGFDVEIFGQNIPVTEQHGYKHLIKEEAILQQMGEDFRKNIIQLKLQGYKTEHAFAKLLGLEGNPYNAILVYNIEN